MKTYTQDLVFVYIICNWFNCTWIICLFQILHTTHYIFWLHKTTIVFFQEWLNNEFFIDWLIVYFFNSAWTAILSLNGWTSKIIYLVFPHIAHCSSNRIPSKSCFYPSKARVFEEGRQRKSIDLEWLIWTLCLNQNKHLASLFQYYMNFNTKVEIQAELSSPLLWKPYVFFCPPIFLSVC